MSPTLQENAVTKMDHIKDIVWHCGSSIKKEIVELWCLCCMMFRWTNKQPGIQKFRNLCCHYQDNYDWISPLKFLPIPLKIAENDASCMFALVLLHQFVFVYLALLLKSIKISICKGKTILYYAIKLIFYWLCVTFYVQ